MKYDRFTAREEGIPLAELHVVRDSFPDVVDLVSGIDDSVILNTMPKFESSAAADSSPDPNERSGLFSTAMESTSAKYDYQLLVGHARTDGTPKTGEQLRTEYIHRTDELVRLITEGVNVDDPVTHERSMRSPDCIVWLDKSARPLAWMMRELWPRLAQEDDGTVPSMPSSHFVNIDREQWVNTVDPLGKGTVDLDRVDQSVIRSLRSIFVSPSDKKEGLTEAIDRAPATFDGKTVLIVDEVYASGRTLAISENFFRAAFPTAIIAGVHWMGGVTQKGFAQGNADLPIWYKDDTHLGRGIGNRNQEESHRSPSLTQRLGGWFLSSRLKEDDPSSTQLRQEIFHLAHDKKVLSVPSYQRDDFEERAERLNDMSFDEFRTAKRRQDGVVDRAPRT